MKTRMETGKRLSPDAIICVPGSSCTRNSHSGNSVLCDEKTKSCLFTPIGIGILRPANKSFIIPVNKDDPCAFSPSRPGLALGPNNRTQDEFQVFEPVIPDWASSMSSHGGKDQKVLGPYDL